MIDENMEKVKREASTDPERHSGLGEERGRRTELRFYKNDSPEVSRNICGNNRFFAELKYCSLRTRYTVDYTGRSS